jgi:hypothetical protein
MKARMNVLLNLKFERWKRKKSDGLVKGLSAETLTMIAPPRVEWNVLVLALQSLTPRTRAVLKGNDADDNDRLGTRGACRS